MNSSILYDMRELCLNFLNLKNYVHITKIESCNLYQSALTIFSQKVLGHLDFGMPGSLDLVMTGMKNQCLKAPYIER